MPSATRRRYAASDARFALTAIGGTAAARPAAGDVPDNTVYTATDSGDVSISRGGAWHQLSGGEVPFVDGSWHVPGSSAPAATAVTQDRAYALYCRIPDKAATVAGLAATVTTAAASSNLRLGVYTVLGTGLPGALITASDSLASTSTGDKTDETLSTPGVGDRKAVYLVAVGQGGTPTVNMVRPTGLIAPLVDVANALAGNFVPYKSGVSGALPANFGTPDGFTGLAPLVAVKLTD